MRMVQTVAVRKPRPIRRLRASLWRRGSFMLRMRRMGKRAPIMSVTMERTEDVEGWSACGECGWNAGMQPAETEKCGRRTSLHNDQDLQMFFTPAGSWHMYIPHLVDWIALKDEEQCNCHM